MIILGQPQGAFEIMGIARQRTSSFISTGRKRKLLKAFASTGRIMASCESQNVPWQTHYSWLQDDEGYAADFARAKEMVCDLIEGEVIRRGSEGWDRKVGFKDGRWQGDTQREYDSNLLMFQAKKLNPAYRENHKIDIQHTHTVSVDDARAGIAAMLERNPRLLAFMNDAVPIEVQPAPIEAEPVIDAEFIDQGSELVEGGTPPQ